MIFPLPARHLITHVLTINMVNMIRWLLLFICSLSSLGLWAQGGDDPVLLTVNGMPVNRSEFVYSYQRNKSQNDGERVTASDYLERFVDYKLKLAAALDAGYVLPNSVSDSPATAERQVYNKVEAEKCYRQVCQAYGNQDLVYPAQILLSVDTRASSAKAEKVKVRIDSVYNALQRGADFAELARELSDDVTATCGGEMGWVAPNQLLEEIERTAYSLRKGEFSLPFQSPAGWHIVKLIDRQPARSETVHQWYLAPRMVKSGGVLPSADDQNLAREYNEGMLISQMTQQTIYDQPEPAEKDLKRYFKKNKKRYGKKLKKRDFPLVRDLVLADYRQFQEQKWVVDLRHRYKVKVNKSMLRTIE